MEIDNVPYMLVVCPSQLLSFLLPKKGLQFCSGFSVTLTSMCLGEEPHPQVLGMSLTGLRVIPFSYLVTGLGAAHEMLTGH